MKTISVIAALCLVSGLASTNAFANDGGIAAIKVNTIKMREVKYKDGQEQVVNRIANPTYRILLSGGEAAKLQKVLPSQLSVLTSMQPEIAQAYNDSFKTLGIYSKSSQEATAKVVTITCTDAELKPLNPGSEDGKVKVVKKSQSDCVISIDGYGTNDPSEELGDLSKFEPVCK